MRNNLPSCRSGAFLSGVGMLLLSVLLLSSCKKDSGAKKPYAISGTVTAIEYVLDQSNARADHIRIDFLYKGSRNSLVAVSSDSIFSNGTLFIKDSNLIAPNSILSWDKYEPNLITVSNPLPDTLTATINKFVTVNGVGSSGSYGDNMDFNKLTLAFTPTTKILVRGYRFTTRDNSWADRYLTDLPGFTQLMRTVAGYDYFNPLSGAPQRSYYTIAVVNF